MAYHITWELEDGSFIDDPTDYETEEDAGSEVEYVFQSGGILWDEYHVVAAAVGK